MGCYTNMTIFSRISTTLQCENGGVDKTALRLINSNLFRVDFTFSKFDHLLNRFANVFSPLAISTGKVVPIFLPKQVEEFTNILGISICGILFSKFGKDALLEMLLDGSTKVLVTKKSLFARIKGIWSQFPAFDKVILTDLSQHVDEWVLSYSALRADQYNRFKVPATDPDEPAILHYTSGPTSKPKVLPHAKNHKWSMYLLSSVDYWISAVSTFYVILFEFLYCKDELIGRSI